MWTFSYKIQITVGFFFCLFVCLFVVVFLFFVVFFGKPQLHDGRSKPFFFFFFFWLIGLSSLACFSAYVYFL